MHALAEQRREAAHFRVRVTRLRALFWIGATWTLIQILMLALAMRETPNWSDSAGTAMTWVSFVVLFLVLGVSIAAALFAHRAPVLWAVAIAGAQTVGLVIELGYGTGFLVQTLLQACLVVAFWVAIPFAVRVLRDMVEHPEYEIENKPIAEARRVHGGAGDHARQRLRHDAVRSSRSMHIIGGIAGGALVIGGLSIWALARPPSSTGAIEAFEAAWNGTGDDAFTGLIQGGEEGAVGKAFFTELARRGWSEKRLRITEPELEERGEKQVIATYGDLHGPVRVLFTRRGEHWKVTGTELPKYKTDSIAFGAKQFERAWSDSGTDTLFAMFKAEYREKNGESVLGRLDNRAWLQRRPALSNAETDFKEATASGVCKWKIAGGDLQVSLQWWHPNWKVTGMRFPKRETEDKKAPKKAPK